ncbi:MAG: type II toxin-antitoxin system PemK/MazF family toxin, partial [Nitrososphaera sp.]
MHSASQRDIVLVPYPFSDLSQAKYRPAIVMSNDVYNRKFKDFIAIP